MTIEVTPELIESVKGIKHWLEFAKQNQPDKSDFLKAVGYPGKAPVKQEWLETILAALPEEVTNPKPEMPTEPGWYLGYDKVTQRQFPVEMSEDGVIHFNHSGNRLLAIANPERFAPFTRLVPEKPPVTAEEVWEILDGQNVDSSVLSELADYINNRA
jgi:hypothetical protein